MASSNVNTLIDQIIKDQKEMLKEKEKQDAIVFQLLQLLSAQKIADPSDQHIDTSAQKIDHIDNQNQSDSQLQDNQNQSDNQVYSDNQNQSDNQVQADDNDLRLSDVAEDCPQSTTTATIIIESPESQGQCVLDVNSPESCGNAQCPESLNLQVQVPESPESNVIVENFGTTENQDHDSKVNSERILLEYIQNEYSGFNQNKLTSERSSTMKGGSGAPTTYLECNDFCSINDCHQNNTILEAIDKLPSTIKLNSTFN